MTKASKVEIVDAEVIEEITTPDYDFEDKRLEKQPKGTRKKDYPAFNPESRAKLLEVIELGVPLDIAADAAGVSISTVQRWLERGEMVQNRIDDDATDGLDPIDYDFAEFYMDCKQYSARGVTKLAQILTDAAADNPHIALKWIEKVRPDHFGAKQAIEMTGKVIHGHLHTSAEGSEIVKRLSTEELKLLKADMTKRKQLKSGEVEEDE